jgi:ribosomal-protein-alanine N-acetyltransferase
VQERPSGELRVRVELEVPAPPRASEFVAAALRSRPLHRGLVAVPSTSAEFGDYLASCSEEGFFSRFVVTAGARELAGVVEIRDCTRGPPACGRLAYYAFVPHARQGLMTEGVELAVAHAFGGLGLEELSADIQRSNRRSVAVVEKLGFRRHAQPIVRKVGRRWLEHERWRLLRGERGAFDYDDAMRA